MKQITFFTLFLLSLNIIFSQDLTNDLPFITDLQIYSHIDTILLKWKNPINNDKPIQIYRSNSMIEKTTKSMLISTVESGITEFTDKPGVGEFYYAVILYDLDNSLFELAIPYRNTLPYPIIVESEKEFKVTSIKSEVSDGIEIRWTYKMEGSIERYVSLYRSLVPITNNDILLNSIKITTIPIKDQLYKDTPLPNINFFYALKEESDIFKFDLAEGVNYTKNSVALKQSAHYIKSISFDSFTPLPLLSFGQNPINGNFFDDPQILKYPFSVKEKIETKSFLNKSKIKHKKEYLKFQNNKKQLLESITPILLSDESIFKPEIYLEQYNSALQDYKNNNFASSKTKMMEIMNHKLSEDYYSRLCFYLAYSCYMVCDYYNSYIFLIDANDIYLKDIKSLKDALDYIIYTNLEK